MNERNLIVWHKSQWRWKFRRVPKNLSLFEHQHGSIALRRTLPPGTVLLRCAMRHLRA